METGAAVEKSVGRRGGQREAGKLGRRGWGGGVEQGSRCQRPAVYVAYLLVHCRAILSCSALLVRYWVAMLPTRGSAERREGKKERRTEREKKKWDILIPRSQREHSILKDADRRWEGHRERERAVGSEPSSSVNERAVWDSTDTSVMCWLSWHNNVRDVWDKHGDGFTEDSKM